MSRKPDNPEQLKRFIETAREVEANEDPSAIDAAFEQVVRSGRKPQNEKPRKG
jgi:hypothetical protein